MTNFADFKAAIEGISGGKNTVLLDKFACRLWWCPSTS